MKVDRRSIPTAFVPLAVVLILVFTYIGTYLMLVRPMDPGIKTLERPYPRRAFYGRFHSQEALTFFGPINWIDRRIRRDTWTTQSYRRPLNTTRHGLSEGQ